MCLNSNIFQLFGLKLNKKYVTNFHPLEVEDRGSEVQLQVGEKLKYLI